MENPFPKLCAEARRKPENKVLLDELGAYFTSVAVHVPRNKNYDFYEYIGSKRKEEREGLPGLHEGNPSDGEETG